MKTGNLVWLAACLLVTGCAELGQFIQSKIPAPMESQRAVSQIPRPVMGLADGVSASQVQGKVTITVQPIIPEPIRRLRYGPQQDFPAGGLGPGQYFNYKVTAMPYYELPGQLLFQIHIENGLGSPLRLNGAVVALRAGGRDIRRRDYQQSYDELQNIMVLPGSSHDMQFLGPAYGSLQNPTTIDFGFFDVVTKVDKASNPLERGQFNWKFNYSRTIETKEEPIQTVTLQQGPGQYNGPCRIDCR